jgi:serine/threonine protein kinase
MSLSTGQSLGPYTIQAPLGAGGMGEVYRARDARLNRDVAIKVIPPSVADNPAALARFEREAHAIAALSHPNILTIFDVGHSDGRPFAVMELLEGETLRARLAQGPLPVRKAVEIAALIARGLAAARATARRCPTAGSPCTGSRGAKTAPRFGLVERKGWQSIRMAYSP